MIHIKKLQGWAVVVAVLTVALAGPLASAQGKGRESISASPASETFRINAGDVKRDSMDIINGGDTAYDFIVYARPYSVSNEQYDPNFSDIKANTNIHKWVQFDKTRYHLKAGEKVTVTYTIRVPQNAAPGGHYGVLFAETQQRDQDATGVVRQKRVGNLVYATVNGKTTTGGTFKQFILPAWQTASPMQSSARVYNSGNVDFEAKVQTIAKDMFGRTKFTYTGDPVVLPETTRLINMHWDKAPNFGVFRVQQKVEFLGQKHENSGYVLIAPRWFVVLAAASIIGGVGYAVYSRRKRRR